MISLDELEAYEKSQQKKELLPKPVRPKTPVVEETPPPPPPTQPTKEGWGEHGDLFEMSDAAKTAEKQERDSGVITNIAGALGYLKNDITADAMNAAAAIPKTLTQGLPEDNILRQGAEAVDQFILSADERDEAQLKIAEYQDAKRAAGDMSAVEATLDTVSNVTEGLAKGIEGGIAFPFTLAARLANQATPWADPPETLKNSPLGNLAFEIAQILTPTLLTGGVGKALGGSRLLWSAATGKTTALGFALESGIETATQDSMVDTIMGRRLASYYGDVWAALSGNKEAGAQFTTDLIEGTKIHAQAITAVSGFLQNLGINIGSEELIWSVGKHLRPQKQLTGTRGNILAPGSEALPPVYYNTDPSVEFFTGEVGEDAAGILRFEKQDFPNGAEIGWTFFNADDAETTIAQKAFNWTPLNDLSNKKIDVEFSPQNDIKLGNRAIRLRSFFNDFARNNLEPGDIVMNSPTYDSSYPLEELSLVQRKKQQLYDEQISARQVEAVEKNLDKEEVWQYFGDLLAVGGKTGQPLSEAEKALKYLSEEEYRVYQQAINPRWQRMNPSIYTPQRAENYKNLINQRYLADVSTDATSVEGVKKWWNTLDDNQKILEAQAAIESDIIREPGYDDISPNVRARIYEGIGFSRPNQQEHQIAKGTQFGVLRKFPTTDGPAGRIVDPLHIEFDGKEIKNLTEVRAQIEAALRVTPPQRRPITKLDEKVALVVKRRAEDIVDEISDTHQPTYNKGAEPHESVNIDSDVPVARGTDENPYISDPALIREILKEKGIGADGLTAADRDFYTNWKAITDEESLIEALRLSTSRLRNIEAFPKDLKRLELRAQQWIQNNIGLIDGNIDQALENFKAHLVAANPKFGMDSLGKQFDTKTLLAEKTATTQEGFLIAAMVGEELGIRLHKLASTIVNLETSGIDFSKAIENLIDLQDKTNLFLIPLRRGKRRWALEGTVQQRKTIQRLKDPDYLAALAEGGEQSIEAPSTAFTKIKFDESDPGATLRELWEAYKGGDGEAGKTLKAYVAAVQATDPIAAVDQVTNLTSVLFEQLRKGNKEAVRQIYYGALLSRVSTQVASAASGIAQLVSQPIGAIGSGVGPALLKGELGEVLEGFGQLAGGLGQIQDALKVGKRAWIANQSLIGGSKVGPSAGNLKLKQDQLEHLYKGAKEELIKNKAGLGEHFNLGLWFNIQTLANHPFMHIGVRSLTALDDTIKSIHGGQIATGRAFREAAESGDVYQGLLNIKEGVNKNYAKVFENGARDGIIIDPEVIAAAKNITFQTAIPHGSGNIFTSAFRQVQNASDNSAIFKFFTPFVRVSYNALDSAVRHTLVGLPGFNQIAGSGPGSYKDILAGKMGKVAQQQLKSQIAFGRMYMMSIAGMALTGNMTGSNSGDMPRNSFIIPSPATKTGYIAIPYDRIEPFGSIASVIVDMVNGFREGVIGEGNYTRFAQEMLYSMAMASFQKSFLAGQQNFAELMDMRNWGKPGRLSKIIGEMTAGLTPISAARMLGSMVQPYETVNRETRFFKNILATYRRRFLGGAGNPLLYDIYTGDKIPKVTSLGNNENYWFNVGGALMNEFVWPGQIQNIKQDAVTKQLFKLGYRLDINYLTKLGSHNLTLEEQSALSRNIGLYGRLQEKLNGYFNSTEFKLAYARLQAKRKDEERYPEDRGFFPNDSSDPESAAGQERKAIFSTINEIHRKAKEEAAQVTLLNDGKFRLKVNNIKPSSMLRPLLQ